MQDKIKLKIYRELPIHLKETCDRCVTKAVNLEDHYRRMKSFGDKHEDMEGWDFIRLVDLACELLADNLRLKEQEERNGK